MNYREEVILASDQVRVRILSLDGGQTTPWHFHREVVDRMLCLEGRIAIEYRNPPERVELSVGGRCEVGMARVHRVVNLTAEEAKYLLVQGVGRYDFNLVDEPSA